MRASTMSGPGRLVANLPWGALSGLLFGVIYVLILGILFVVRGPELFRYYNTSFGEIAILYLYGGVGGGLIVGLLRPLLRWWWGAALVGVVAVIPVGFAFQLMRSGFAAWGPKDTLVVVIFSIGFGATVGWVNWGMFRNTS
jgi:hypothetical protein